MEGVVTVCLLGVAQDGGCPSLGCECPNCAHARDTPGFKNGRVASLGVVDELNSRAFLVDATPSIIDQLYELMKLPGATSLGAILLTHAHMGHYAGLLQLGRESRDMKGVPVLCTASMATFLSTNLPWRLLVEQGNIQLVEVTPGVECQLTSHVKVTPISVPHRQEISDTVAYLFSIDGIKKVLYCPDTDTWAGWNKDIKTWCSEVEVALLDGTFYNAKELTGIRDVTIVPHPFVTTTCAHLSGVSAQVVLIHFNHRNPLLDPGSQQVQTVEGLGFTVGQTGMYWTYAITAEPLVTEGSFSEHDTTESEQAFIESVVDWGKVMENFGGDEDFVRELLTDLYIELKDEMVKLKEMVAQDDGEECGNIGHAIKGASANLMAWSLKEAGFNMQIVGRKYAQNKGDAEGKKELAAAFNTLQAEVDRYRLFLVKQGLAPERSNSSACA